VQGALRAAYKNSQAGADMATPKSAAEGATFSAAVLPLVHHCNAASAAVVSDNLKFGLFPTGGDAVTARYSDFAAVKAAFEDVYACLGITCAHVGSLIGASGAMAQECSPPVKVVPDSPYSVTARVTAAGSVADYGPVVLALLECSMAVVAKVSCDAVTATVTAGSVIIEFTIVTEDAAATAALVTTALATPELASSALGVEVETVPTVAQTSFSPPSPPPLAPAGDDSGLPVGTSIGIAVGAIVGVCLLVAIGVAALRKKKATKNVVVRELSFPEPAPYAEENGNGATKPPPSSADAVPSGGAAVPVVRSISTEKI